MLSRILPRWKGVGFHVNRHYGQNAAHVLFMQLEILVGRVTDIQSDGEEEIFPLTVKKLPLSHSMYRVEHKTFCQVAEMSPAMFRFPT